MNRLPLHPLLFAAFPVLALWSENRSEVRLTDVDEVLLVVVAIALGLAVLASLAFRHVLRGSIVASHAVVLALTFGSLWATSAGIGWAVSALVLAVVIVVALRVTDAAVQRWNGALNVIGVVLVLVNGAPPLLFGPSSTVVDVGDDQRPIAVGSDAPDIVWIVPDRYGRADSLQQLFGFDNNPFLQGLEERGFTVLDESLANYNKTAHSMASTLNLGYLEQLAALPPEEGDDWGPVYSLLGDHEVGRVLTAAGYEYIHLGNWWQPTSSAVSADLVLNHETASEFAQVFREATVWPTITGAFADDAEPVTHRTRHRNHILYGFDQLERLAAQDSERPRFILAHIPIPHEPYVLGADGDHVTEELARSRSRSENIVNQVQYANRRLEAIIDRFLDRPADEQPVIILQADEGTHPPAYEVNQGAFAWPDATDAELGEKLRILNAWFVPEGLDVEPWPSLTPVNTFRLLLDAIVGTDYGTVEDRSFVFTDESHLYDFTDVTQRVRSAP